MYRGKTTIEEAMNLPNRVFSGLFHIRRKELMDDRAKQEEVVQSMEEEAEGGV